jgi:hypothetical protein
MRQNRSSRVGLINILGLIALASWSMSSLAQAQRSSPPAPARDINPPVANCNVTPDTNQASVPATGQPTATPITAALLTSGQPCQQVVSTRGLVAGNGLANLQRGFDFYSWLTFIAMNSPADGKTIGQGPRPGGDAFTKWEDLANFRPLGDVMLAKGAKPTWGERIVPKECKSLDGKSSDGRNKIIFPSRGGGVQPAVQDRPVDRSRRQLCTVRHPDESADVRFHRRERLVQQTGPAELQTPDPLSTGKQPGHRGHT